MDEQPQITLTKYGMMRKNYLKEYKKGIYSGMLLSGKLTSHLQEIQETAEQRMELLMSQMAKAQGVNEELKEKDQMLWTQKMNNIQQAVEETILNELIYN
ncbi:MAG: TnpV protein [Lachnospiraceae bacterium]|nr:TnpV protein [Lachnospiraceae bacterium]